MSTKVPCIPDGASPAIALIGAFAIVWVNLTVGIVGSDGEPLNLMFYAVIALGLLSVGLAIFRILTASTAMALTAVAQLAAAAAAFALSRDPGAFFAAFMAMPFMVSSGLMIQARSSF